VPVEERNRVLAVALVTIGAERDSVPFGKATYNKGKVSFLELGQPKELDEGRRVKLNYGR
jgi:hypothetical protein